MKNKILSVLASAALVLTGVGVLGGTQAVAVASAPPAAAATITHCGNSIQSPGLLMWSRYCHRHPNGFERYVLQQKDTVCIQRKYSRYGAWSSCKTLNQIPFHNF